jgi:hypothetical protein
MTDPQVRRAALERVAAGVGEDTRVMVGHSLGGRWWRMRRCARILNGRCGRW